MRVGLLNSVLKGVLREETRVLVEKFLFSKFFRLFVFLFKKLELGACYTWPYFFKRDPYKIVERNMLRTDAGDAFVQSWPSVGMVPTVRSTLTDSHDSTDAPRASVTSTPLVEKGAGPKRVRPSWCAPRCARVPHLSFSLARWSHPLLSCIFFFFLFLFLPMLQKVQTPKAIHALSLLVHVSFLDLSIFRFSLENCSK